jgi:hypothetical protein
MTFCVATALIVACDRSVPAEGHSSQAAPAPAATTGAVVTVNSNKQDPPAQAKLPEASAFADAVLEYRIIPAPNNTFGYEILGNGRLFVHQTNLPGLPGVEGCRTREDAEKLARFVTEKIRRGEMPPSVSPLELDSLGIH